MNPMQNQSDITLATPSPALLAHPGGPHDAGAEPASTPASQLHQTAARPTSGRTASPTPRPLYTPSERRKRDQSPWTLIQGLLAPMQFLVFAVSLALVIRYLTTGGGYGAATASILIKTAFLYAIMITGSIWEKDVFGKWLFARSFFWEDVVSMVVMALHTLYVFMLIFGWGTPNEQMLVALAAYVSYVINAVQFVLKLREARLQAAATSTAPASRHDINPRFLAEAA